MVAIARIPGRYALETIEVFIIFSRFIKVAENSACTMQTGGL
jgi:hypothetical protein